MRKGGRERPFQWKVVGIRAYWMKVVKAQGWAGREHGKGKGECGQR